LAAAANPQAKQTQNRTDCAVQKTALGYATAVGTLPDKAGKSV